MAIASEFSKYHNWFTPKFQLGSQEKMLEALIWVLQTQKTPHFTRFQSKASNLTNVLRQHNYSIYIYINILSSPLHNILHHIFVFNYL